MPAEAEQMTDDTERPVGPQDAIDMTAPYLEMIRPESAPLVPLSPRLRVLQLLRQTLEGIQFRAPTGDLIIGQQIADCLEIVDEGICDAVREQQGELASQLNASRRLASVERQLRTVREHLGISA